MAAVERVTPPRFVNGLCARMCALWLAALFFPAAALALSEEPEPRLSQLAHRTWRVSDASLPSSPNAIAQTSDGYIWIATNVDLLRFDGVRFVAFSAPGGESIVQPLSLLASADGTLWVGARSGIFHLQEGRFSALKRRVRANQMVQGSDGKIWFASSARDGTGATGPLCSIVGDDYTCADAGPREAAGQTLASDGLGGFWFGLVERSLCHWSPTSSSCSMVESKDPGPGQVGTVSRMPNGDVWLGAKEKDAAPRLLRFIHDAWSDPTSLPGADSSSVVQVIKADRRGALWAGTSNSGLYRIGPKRTERMTAADGLSANVVGDMLLDREGSMWVLTSEGIDQFFKRPIETWSMREGLSADSVSSIAVDGVGKVYFGNEGALDVLEADSIHSFKAGSGLPGQTVEALFADGKKEVWLGLDRKLWKFEDATFSPIIRPDDGLSNVTNIERDAEGIVWFRSKSKLYRINGTHAEPTKGDDYKTAGELAADPESGVWECSKFAAPAHFVGDSVTIKGKLPNEKALAFPPVLAFHGYVWCATSDGLNAWKDGVSRTLGAKNGLSIRLVYSAVVDREGNLWLMTERSYIEILKSDLEAWLVDGNFVVRPREFGTEDGARPGLATFGRSATLAPNGELWFATDRFAQRIRPEALGLNALPPPVHVESVRADGDVKPAADGISLPAALHTLEINYTALSFVNPALVVFRYRLDGFDKEWQEVGSRRQAVYTDLPPGTYTFEVTASNSDGVWATAPATFSFVAEPAFFQTWWFHLGITLVAAMLVTALYQFRKRQIMRSVRQRLYERLAERERIARELHDTFFQGIQGLLLRFHTGAATLRSDDPVRRVFEETLEQSDQVMLEGRELVLDLRERLDDDKPLCDVLRAVGEDLAELHTAHFSLALIGAQQPLESEVREELFRIGKEALVNAFRHADASTVRVDLTYDRRQCELQVSDDGKGVDATVLDRGRRAGHWGLPGMRERAERINASFSVQSRKGEGTKLVVVVPAASAYAHLTGRRLFSPARH